MFEYSEYVPDGHLDQDTDMERLDPKNYPDAKNIRHLTTDSKSTLAVVNIQGNDVAFTIEPSQAQNKKYKVTGFSGNGTTTHNLLFYDQNGSNWTTVIFTEGATVALSIANLQTAINTTIAGTTIYTVGSDFLIFEPTFITGYDYSVTCDDLTLVVVQEAFAASMAGMNNIIGSKNILDDVFIYSTPSTEMPTVLPLFVSNATTNGSGRFRVTTSAPHGLTTGDLINITGVNGMPNLDGFFIVTVISSVQFDAEEYYANFAGVFAASPNSTITINSRSIGEIGVARKNFDTDSWLYTRLIRSWELDFRVQKQIDADIERTDSQFSNYFTDDYNDPRTFYYSGEFITDGAITAINPNGRYAYGTIDLEMATIAAPSSARLEYTGQTQSGGQVLSGDWRYTIRFLSESFSSTPWGTITNPISVYTAPSNNTTNNIFGNQGGVVTPKINNFSVTGIPPGVFKYVELAGINYVDLAQVGYIIKRVELSEGQTEIEISHTGTETTTDLDLGTLNDTSVNYATALNVRIMDNRLVLSNLTAREEKDFSAWAASFTHSLQRVLVTATYKEPDNVYALVGYMLNETYRFMVRPKMKKGGYTRAFWIDDIRFDVLNTSPSGRRTAGLPSYDLTVNAGTRRPYAFYVNFDNIDLDFLIDGVPVRSLIDYFEIVRAECIQEVLACGMSALTVSGGTAGLSDATLLDGAPGGTAAYFEYPFISNADNGVQIPYPSTGTARRNYQAFYSPDILYLNTAISTNSGSDVMYNFGNPIQYASQVVNTGDNYQGVYAEYDGYTNQTAFPTGIVVSEGFTIPDGGSVTFSTGDVLSKMLTNTPYGDNNTWQIYRSPVFNTIVPFTHTGVNTDYGFYYSQYVRTIPDKYGPITSTISVTTGARFDITQFTTGIVNIDVFGGDTFTQKFLFLYRLQASSTPYGFDGLGFNGACSFFCQSRVNADMVRRDIGSAQWCYPFNNTLLEWLNDNFTDFSAPQYNRGYNIRNGVQSYVAFDADSPINTDMPARIIYSESKPQNSQTDNYRQFLPLNFRDNDLTWGEIIHMEVYNRELITFQPRSVQRQYFNTTAIINTASGQEVVLGSGSVLERDPQSLTTIGTKHKWSVIKGRSDQGSDNLYWISTEFKKAMRMGYDGTISLADIRGMRSFFANNLKWADDQTTPAAGQGIHGVWDERFSETIWTVRARRDVQTWTITEEYGPGEAVFFQPSVFSTFEQTGEIYISQQNNNLGNTPENNPTWWIPVSHTDTNYWNEFTIVYSETKNGFLCFVTPKPKIYLAWRDGYLSPRPVGDVSTVYEHNAGEFCVWYDEGSDFQEEDGYFEGHNNMAHMSIKSWVATAVSTDIVPERLDFTTPRHTSFLTAPEFEAREDGFYAPIKNDSTTTGVNDSDTDRLWGKWIKSKLTFKARVYQRLVSYVTKYRTRPRGIQK